MSNHRRTPVMQFDSRYKSWRGPVLESRLNESNSDDNNLHSAMRPSRPNGQSFQSGNEDIDKVRARIRNTVKSACHGDAPLRAPRVASVPVVNWSPPPIEDHRKRRSAFDFGRPSRSVYGNNSEESCRLRRRSRCLFDELERERQEHSQLRREVVRLRNKHGRIGRLVNEIANLRIENESIAREIQGRRQANGSSQLNAGNREPHRRPVQHASRF